jgi:hypothetical protein
MSLWQTRPDQQDLQDEFSIHPVDPVNPVENRNPTFISQQIKIVPDGNS